MAGDSAAIQELRAWQREMAERPRVFTVRVRSFGEDEDCGNIYDSKEAAEYEAAWHRSRGNRARVVSLGNLHNADLARRRWGEPNAR